jgi:hypothetical protein
MMMMYVIRKKKASAGPLSDEETIATADAPCSFAAE